MLSIATTLFGIAALVSDAGDQKVTAWKFDANLLRATSPVASVLLRPLGNQHGVVMEKLGDGAAPSADGRPLLHLQHYLEKGRSGEYVPTKLDHVAVLSRDRLTLRFPVADKWPVTTQLTYSFPSPGTIDARFDFTFREPLTHFEAYVVSHFAASFEPTLHADEKWEPPETESEVLLLIPRDDNVAGRFQDGRWTFRRNKVRLSESRFDLPVIVHRDEKTGWAIIQMAEPGVCTHLAVNGAAGSDGFVLGGWDVKANQKRSARLRLLLARKPADEQIRQAYQSFADECRQARADRKE